MKKLLGWLSLVLIAILPLSVFAESLPLNPFPQTHHWKQTYNAHNRSIEIDIQIAVPEKWVGKTLRNLDVRNTYGINVIAISHPSNHSVDISINPNNPLSKDYALVLLGTDYIIMKFAKTID